ncbi:MAG: hypothetical protein K2X82_10670 [Gemmataceae bacterium]|nr:hypothetical protein [Gemmataceae bacterium]
MRRWSALIPVAVLLGVGLGAGVWAVWSRGDDGLPDPLPVPAGDQEIAWLHTTTGGDTWALFVIGLKRTEMPVDGQPSGLTVDDSRAFPEQSTAVPEVVVSRAGVAGRLRIRWYKLSAGATTDQWVRALAGRDPAPLAILGGSTSDRAYDLAVALERQTEWRGDRPLLFLTTATLDNVYPPNPHPDDHPHHSELRNLLDLYPGRSFRFCFSNAQMVRAVTDFVLQDPTLRPGPTGYPGLHLALAAAAGPWATFGDLADLTRGPTVFPLEWQDDPYSGDLYNQFREYLYATLSGPGGSLGPPKIVSDPAFSIPFSVGGFSRPNAGELAAVRAILRDLPPPGERSLVVVPTVSGPARRVLLALAERVPQAGRRLVAVNGDGASANTYFRDAEWAWPARSIPIPMVFFTHDHPFGWDAPGDPAPPGYRLVPKNTTEEVRLDTTIGRIVADAVFPPGSGRIADRADEVAARLRDRPDRFFDARGNRRGESGEYVVVVRPTTRYGDLTPGAPRPEAVIEVYRRAAAGRTWRPVPQPNGKPVEVLPERPDDRGTPE